MNHGPRPAGATPKFAPGARVLWHLPVKGGPAKIYPATVIDAKWYRRTREPWNYSIRLDATKATARMSHLLRFPPESQLTELAPADPFATIPNADDTAYNL